MKILRTCFCLLGITLSANGAFAMLEKGTQAPELTVLTHTGDSVELAEAYASGPVLVYFYPKADTPGCTKQACNLRDNFADLEDAGVTVFGVSTDSVKAQAKFREKYNLPFTLISDSDKELGKAFGVGSYMGMAYKRQTFLIVDGVVVWSDGSATPATQTEDALAALQEVK
jgi:peroxiredoxin Q/BCP